MKRPIALIAARPRPGHPLGRRRATSQTGSPSVAAWAITRESEVWPIPRRGLLATRVKLIWSAGLASSER